MMKSYDVIIPLGTFCAASYQLRQNDLQLESYPLDWVGVTSVKTAAELIINNFGGFFDKERLVCENIEDGDYMQYIQEPEKYLFYHCMDKKLPFDEAYAKARATFDRRIERLYNVINKAQKILFMATNNRLITKQEAVEVQSMLAKKFPAKDIDLIVVDYGNQYQGLKGFQLNKNVDFFTLEFDHEKNAFSDKEKELAIVLKDRRLGSAVQRIKRKISKAAFKAKRFAVNTLCCLIPNKKWRKAVRAKCDVSTKMFGRK